MKACLRFLAGAIFLTFREIRLNAALFLQMVEFNRVIY